MLKEEGFEENWYNKCVINKTIDKEQCTILFYIDNLKIIHKDPKLIDGIVNILRPVFGNVSKVREKQHIYLSLDFDFVTKGEVKILIESYFCEIVNNFPDKIEKAKTPAALFLFNINKAAEKKPLDKNDLFQHFLVRLLWGCLQICLDHLTALLFFTSRV